MNLSARHGAVHIRTAAYSAMYLLFVEGIAGESGTEIEVKRQQCISKVKGARPVPVVATPEMSSGILLSSSLTVYMVAL